MDASAANARDRAIAAAAWRDWGVHTADELVRLGLKPDAIARRVRRRVLQRLHRGVFYVGAGSPPPQARILAAVKACGAEAVASHRSAAWLHGLTERRGGLVHVTVSGTAPRARRGIVVHRTREIDRRDRATAQKIPVMSPARALVELASIAGRDEVRRAIRQAQALDRVTCRGLARALSRLRWRPGVRTVRDIIATGPAPTRSELEDVVLDLLLGGGFVHPEVNQPLVLDGRTVVPDLRWPDQRLIVEADGRQWHDDPISRADDAQRQALLEAHGERVLRVTWQQAVARPEETLTRVRRAGAPLVSGREGEARSGI